jgi:hypothetical protein
MTVGEGSHPTIAEESHPAIAEGHQVTSLAIKSFNLAKKIQDLENLVVDLYNALINEEPLLPVVSEYMTVHQQKNPRETDGNESHE